MDLSKAFNSLNHDLLIAKLRVYGSQTDALRHMKSYLMNRGQMGGWPSGLRRCNQNWEDPSLNLARHSSGLRDPTSLRGCQ